MPSTLPGNDCGVTTGTTPLTIVSAPGGSVYRMVKTITVFNADTIEHNIIIRLTVSGTDYRIAKQTIQPEESFIFGGDGELIVLNATTKSITFTLGEGINDDQLEWTTNYLDLVA